jgi:hypothetical protein
MVIKKGAAGTVIQTLTDTQATWDATKNAYKIFVGPFTTAPVTGNDYTVSLKEGSRLRKKFTGVTITAGAANVLEKLGAGDVLQVADFNNDNRMDLVDFGDMSAAFVALTTPVTSANKKYDLNSDSEISIEDLSIFLQNFTVLVKAGDAD